jgi:hypothetical protein
MRDTDMVYFVLAHKPIPPIPDLAMLFPVREGLEVCVTVEVGEDHIVAGSFAVGGTSGDELTFAPFSLSLSLCHSKWSSRERNWTW